MAEPGLDERVDSAMSDRALSDRALPDAGAEPPDEKLASEERRKRIQERHEVGKELIKSPAATLSIWGNGVLDYGIFYWAGRQLFDMSAVASHAIGAVGFFWGVGAQWLTVHGLVRLGYTLEPVEEGIYTAATSAGKTITAPVIAYRDAFFGREGYLNRLFSYTPHAPHAPRAAPPATR